MAPQHRSAVRAGRKLWAQLLTRPVLGEVCDPCRHWRPCPREDGAPHPPDPCPRCGRPWRCQARDNLRALQRALAADPTLLVQARELWEGLPRPPGAADVPPGLPPRLRGAWERAPRRRGRPTRWRRWWWLVVLTALGDMAPRQVPPLLQSLLGLDLARCQGRDALAREIARRA